MPWFFREAPQWSCLRTEQTVEAGGQLDGIRLIVVAGSLGSQLMPREKKEKKKKPQPLGRVVMEKLLILQV